MLTFQPKAAHSPGTAWQQKQQTKKPEYGEMLREVCGMETSSSRITSLLPRDSKPRLSGEAFAVAAKPR